MATDAPALPAGLTKGKRPPGLIADRGFRILALAAGLMVLVILALIAIYTTREAWPWFSAEGLGIFSDNWDPAHQPFGAGGLIYGTLLVAGVAVLLSLPISVGIALFVTDVAPQRLRRPIVYTVDLLAAIPSVVYGLWALFVLAEPLASLFQTVSDATASIPILNTLFANPSASGKSFMTAGIIVAIMITPIITSITREVFATVRSSPGPTGGRQVPHERVGDASHAIGPQGAARAQERRRDRADRGVVRGRADSTDAHRHLRHPGGRDRLQPQLPDRRSALQQPVRGRRDLPRHRRHPRDHRDRDRDGRTAGDLGGHLPERVRRAGVGPRPPPLPAPRCRAPC